jgi:hypothetical protein
MTQDLFVLAPFAAIAAAVILVAFAFSRLTTVSGRRLSRRKQARRESRVDTYKSNRTVYVTGAAPSNARALALQETQPH